MKNFEIFDRIINGDLRPHKYESDVKLLEEKIKNLEITDEDFVKHVKYLDKKGKRYSIKITDTATGDIILDETRNDEFNELFDIDIPPLPVKEGEKYLDVNALNDEKAELYLDLIEFEYARILISIDEYFNNSTENQLKEYAILNIQKLKKLWQELLHYEKLIIKGKGLDWNKSNDYVIIVLSEFLKRICYKILEDFSPYIEDRLRAETMHLLNAEWIKSSAIFREFEMKELAEKYKVETGYNIPWSVPLFESEREKISKFSNINDRLIRYKDYLTFWKRSIRTNVLLDVDNEISKKIIPLIENEIENLEYHLSLSTNTEYKTLDEKVNEDTIKHKLIWFGTEKELDVLLHLWQKENLINKNANINLCKANFVDKDYNCYSTEESIKIQWMGFNTELAFSLGLLFSGTSKLLSDEMIWAKSEQIFLNKNNKRIKHLSVAYQSTPTRFDFLKSLVKKAINK